METEKSTIGPAAADQGDLDTIDDIDPATAEALAQVGIRQAADLAAYTPATLAKVLREQAGLRVPAKRIESKNWIGQAQARVQPGAAPDASAPPGAPQARPTPPPATVPQWHQCAGFTVFFDILPGAEDPTAWQTRIYHDESGAEALFPGTDSAPWVAWMLERVDPHGMQVAAPAAPPPEPPPSAASAEPPVPSSPTLSAEPPAPPSAVADAALPDSAPGAALSLSPPDIMPIVVLSMDLLEIPGPDGGTVQLAAEVGFRITDSAIVIAESVEATYQIEIRLVDLETQTARRVAGRMGQCQRETTDYTIDLPFPIPSLGGYEMESVIVLQSAGQVQAHYQGQGPRFQVVADTPVPSSKGGRS
jgi:hypothetical protein